MGRDLASVIEHDVGEETLITAQEPAAAQGAGEVHLWTLPRHPSEDKPTMPNPTAAMLTIGDEILSGRTRDSNMPHLAAVLVAAGIDLREARVVPDTAVEIVAAVNALRGRYDHVFTSGGIGPTHDDITADCVATAFGVPLAVREDARAILASHYPRGEADLNPARLRMARIPEGATLIGNPVSKAPGFTIGNVHVMAGVPAVFEAMVAGLVPRLAGGRPLASATARVMVPEGEIAGPLAEIAAAHPAVTIGCYPFDQGGRLGANLVLRSADPQALAAAEAALGAMLASLSPPET
jgi:molybdenum cofactor synthesis domain-containing protein